MPDQDKAGFEIRGRFYPMPEAFRLCDPVLVTELTGMDFNEFAEALDDEDRRRDPVVLVGLVGIAVWQEHRGWRREKVVKFIQQINVDELESHGGDDDDGPPAQGQTETTEDDGSGISSSTSRSPAEPPTTEAAPV